MNTTREVVGVNGASPKLGPKDYKAADSTPPWYTVAEQMRGLSVYKQTPAEKRERLLARWGHVAVIANCLKLIELSKRQGELMNELLMGLLTRLDWNKPIVKGEADASAVEEILG